MSVIFARESVGGSQQISTIYTPMHQWKLSDLFPPKKKIYIVQTNIGREGCNDEKMVCVACGGASEPGNILDDDEEEEESRQSQGD